MIHLDGFELCLQRTASLLKKSTVGLVRLEDFQQRRKELEEAKAREAARTNELKYVFRTLLRGMESFEWLIERGEPV